MTPFTEVYDAFFALITDDMYMEITKEETEADCQTLLLASLPLFEFPKQSLDFNKKCKYFVGELTLEEINILATGMTQIWQQRQINSIEVIRQKASGPDFKTSSQAAHLQRLLALIQTTKDEHRRLQMLYSRREKKGDKYESTFGRLVKRK